MEIDSSSIEQCDWIERLKNVKNYKNFVEKQILIIFFVSYNMKRKDSFCFLFLFKITIRCLFLSFLSVDLRKALNILLLSVI